MRIQDKVVVITGGASGLGLATAHYLVQEKGARVAIFDLNVEAGDKAVADLGPDRAMFVQTDVSNEESVQKAVDAVMTRFGAIHVCINGAATAGRVQGARQGRQGRAAGPVCADHRGQSQRRVQRDVEVRRADGEERSRRPARSAAW